MTKTISLMQTQPEKESIKKRCFSIVVAGFCCDVLLLKVLMFCSSTFKPNKRAAKKDEDTTNMVDDDSRP